MDKVTDPKQQSITKAQDNLLQIPKSRRDVNRIASGIINRIIEQELSALETDIKLRYWEKLIEAVRSNEQVKGLILEEVDLHPEKTFEEHGVEITKKELGVRFDFSDCGDSHHIELLNQIAELKAALKRRETLLKSIDGEMADPETGEILYPPVRKSTTGISVKLS